MSPEVRVDAKIGDIVTDLSSVLKSSQFKQSLYLELYLSTDSFKFIKSYILCL